MNTSLASPPSDLNVFAFLPTLSEYRRSCVIMALRHAGFVAYEETREDGAPLLMTKANLTVIALTYGNVLCVVSLAR